MFHFVDRLVSRDRWNNGKQIPVRTCGSTIVLIFPLNGGNLKSILRVSGFGLVGVMVLASVLVHPSGAVKSAKSGSPLLAGAEIDAPVLTLFERSCQNCHSEKTEWPWYSYVAPMSWLVENDVAQARSQFNLSHWDEYSLETKQAILTRMGAVARSRQMPPARYTVLHKSAKLSPSEAEQIYAWAHTERRRLKSVPATSVGATF
jgi:hypothetical protein